MSESAPGPLSPRRLEPTIRKSWTSLLAVVVLGGVLASLVPCETPQFETAPQRLASLESGDSLPSSEPAPSCPENCPCLCAASCSGALVSPAVELVFDTRLQALVATIRVFHSRLVPEYLFRPPRPVSVV